MRIVALGHARAGMAKLRAMTAIGTPQWKNTN
jgi:hypothetical protein